MGSPDREKLLQDIETALDQVRPYLMSDGGDCEVVSVSDDGGVVHLRLLGACGDCPSSMMTLKMGIERQLKEAVPGIREVHSEEAREIPYRTFGLRTEAAAKPRDSGAES